MLSPERELKHVIYGPSGDAPPDGAELDKLSYPGGEKALARARQVLSAVLRSQPLPDWFTAQCVDDAAIRDCEIERWSLRAWKYWLEPENRRWWWWNATTDGDRIELTAVIRSRPYLRGSIDWLFKASAQGRVGNPPEPSGSG